ncbi:MAG TPA: hypothetical protein VM146_11845 [Steroidobacteraceae bacterium]|nr:hypothetical protein [Steroidobacteraceae bacterium]
MSAFSRCRQAILTAADERAVHMLLHECLSDVRHEIYKLPAACQELLARDEIDIHEAAVELLRADLAFTGDPASGALLRELANVHAAASVRIGQLQSRHPPAA